MNGEFAVLMQWW